MEASPQQITVVLADDHNVIRVGLRSLLEAEADLRVIGEAADAPSAAKLVGDRRPDVLVLDLQMPGAEPRQDVPRLRESSPGTAIVVLTMQNDPRAARDLLRAGASGYVLKSAPAEDIARAVKAVTSGGTFLGGDFAGGKPSEVEKLLDLSPRERQILELLAEGLRVKEIAERLQLSPATVHTHVRNAIAKLEVDTRTEAVALAVRFSYLGAGGGAL